MRRRSDFSSRSFHTLLWTITVLGLILLTLSVVVSALAFLLVGRVGEK